MYFIHKSHPSKYKIMHGSFESYSFLHFKKKLAHNLAHYICAINVRLLLNNVQCFEDQYDCLLVPYLSPTSHLVPSIKQMTGKYSKTACDG